MKNIVSITLIALVVLLAGVIIKYSLTNTAEKLPNYLPANISTKQQLTLFQANSVPANQTIRIGPNEEEEVAFDVVSTQGQYLNEDRTLALTISVEELDSNQFDLYKEKTWQRYTEPSRGGTSTQLATRDHDVYLSFRTLEESTDTSGMVVMGGGYVFFPEHDVAISYSLLNPRLHACEDIWKPETCRYDAEKQLPTIEDARAVAEQILSNFLGTAE